MEKVLRGNITRRGKKSWRIKIDLGRDANGKRQIRYETVHGKRQDAERALTDLLKSFDDRTLVNKSKVTVGEFFDRWVRDWAADHLSPKTVERFQELIPHHIKPRLGTIKLQEMMPADLVEFYAALLREGRIRGGKLSPATVGQIHRVLHRAPGHAVTWAAARTNVAAAARPPKKVADKVQILTAEQVESVLRKTQGLPLYPIILFALGTGARRGEIMALRWRNIDFDSSRARIDRSLEQTKAGLRFRSPKTKYGRRNIALPVTVVAELRSVWKAQQEVRLALGMGKGSPNDLVFATPEGGPKKPDEVSREWR